MPPMVSVLVAFAFGAALAAGLIGIFRAVERAMLRKLEPEGFVLRSGRTKFHLVLRKYRAPRRYSGYRMSRAYGEVVLTRKSLVIVAPSGLRIGGEDLSSFEMRDDGERVYLHTEQPADATGRVELSFKTDQPGVWLAALSQRGARRVPA